MARWRWSRVLDSDTTVAAVARSCRHPARAYPSFLSNLAPLLLPRRYKKGELEGKNISCLMPQPFSGRHNGYLKSYLTTGKAKILDQQREVVAMHKERYVFPISVLVTKVSGQGADSMFMGVLKVSACSGLGAQMPLVTSISFQFGRESASFLHSDVAGTCEVSGYSVAAPLCLTSPSPPVPRIPPAASLPWALPACAAIPAAQPTRPFHRQGVADDHGHHFVR